MPDLPPRPLRRPHGAALLAAVVAAAMLSACGASGIDTAFVSGAASMRIEVEAYQGPLSKEKLIQDAELQAQIQDLENLWPALIKNVQLLQCRYGCMAYDLAQKELISSVEVAEPSKLGCAGEPYYGGYAEAGSSDRSRICPILSSLQTDTSRLGDMLGARRFVEVYPKTLREVLVWIDESLPSARFKSVYADAPPPFSIDAYKAARQNVTSALAEYPENKSNPQDGLAAVVLRLDGATYADFGRLVREILWYYDAGQEGFPEKALIDLDGWFGPSSIELAQDAFPELDRVAAYFNTPPQGEGYGPDQYREAARFGALLRTRAEYWMGRLVSEPAMDPLVGREVARFARLASEYGDQIGSRADALMKQTDAGGWGRLFRDQLAASVYLRDADPSRYNELVEYIAVSDPGDDRYRDNEPGFVERGTDRVRTVENLLANEYWVNVNTAFAAGQGTVRMVFYKDDIGNWNLKNYDNDASELVDAYKDAGLALIGGVTQMATGTGPAQLAFAEQLVYGTKSPTEVTSFIEGFNKQAVDHIQAFSRDQQKEVTDLDKKIADAKKDGDGTIAQAKAKYDAAESALKTANDELAKAQVEHRFAQEKRAALDAESTAATTDAERIAIRDKIIAAQKGEATTLDAVRTAEGKRDTAKREYDAAATTLAKATSELAALEAERAGVLEETAIVLNQILAAHNGAINQLAANPPGAAPVEGLGTKFVTKSNARTYKP